MKRKELKTRRKLFVENPPPEKKKPRILTPTVTVPVPTMDGRLRQHTIAPALEDPTDRALKHIDFTWKSVEWGLREEARKEELSEYENFTDLEGLIRYVTAGGFRAFKNPCVVDTLIAFQDVYTDDTRPTEQRKKAAREIEKIWKAAKKLVGGNRRTKTPRQRKEKKRKNDLEVKQTSRSLRYFDQAMKQFREGKKDIDAKEMPKNVRRKMLHNLVLKIIDKEFSRGGRAKQYAKSLFLEAIRIYLVSP